MAQARRVPRANEANKMFIVMALLIILGKEQNNMTFWQVIETDFMIKLKISKLGERICDNLFKVVYILEHTYMYADTLDCNVSTFEFILI